MEPGHRFQREVAHHNNRPFASEDRFTRCGISVEALRGVGQLSSRVASAHSFAHYGGNCFWPEIYVDPNGLRRMLAKPSKNCRPVGERCGRLTIVNCASGLRRVGDFVGLRA